MPEFMILVHESETSAGSLPPAETQRLLEQQADYERKLRAGAAWIDGERLRPSAEARRVRRTAETKLQVDEGALAAPALTAYCVVHAADLTAAVQLFAEYPLPPGAELEVRPVLNGHLEPDKTSHKGRVFAFAVLGAAAEEGSWVQLMDRIDERTRGGFPESQFSGGARLEAPSRGRTLKGMAGRRAVVDGPFLESKEVIGGLFFLRMASVEEAVEWAGRSAFVEHGTLEIRELWRS